MGQNRKSIRVNRTTYDWLLNKKNDDETWDELFHRIIGEGRNPKGDYEPAILRLDNILDADDRIQLLVEITTSRQGWEIDTKAIGNVDISANDSNYRAQLVQGLKEGDRAKLVLENSNFTFDVDPVITWRVRDEDLIVNDVVFNDIYVTDR